MKNVLKIDFILFPLFYWVWMYLLIEQIYCIFIKSQSSSERKNKWNNWYMQKEVILWQGLERSYKREGEERLPSGLHFWIGWPGNIPLWMQYLNKDLKKVTEWVIGIFRARTFRIFLKIMAFLGIRRSHWGFWEKECRIWLARHSSLPRMC